MSLTPLEVEVLHSLYRKADKVQKTAFVDWISHKVPGEKPPELTTVEEHLAARTGNPTCPRCRGQHLVKNGTHDGRQRFICKDCGKTVGLSNGTPYYRSKHSLAVWNRFQHYAYSRWPLRDCADVCHISLRTASAWRGKLEQDLGK